MSPASVALVIYFKQNRLLHTLHLILRKIHLFGLFISPSHHTYIHHQYNSAKLASPRTTRFNKILLTEQYFPTELTANGYNTHPVPSMITTKSFEMLRTLYVGAMTPIRKQIRIDHKNNNMIKNKTTLYWSYFPSKHIFIGKTKGKDLIRLHMFYKWYIT